MARGLRFSARVTSYRNVRFNFTGTAWRVQGRGAGRGGCDPISRHSRAARQPLVLSLPVQQTCAMAIAVSRRILGSARSMAPPFPHHPLRRRIVISLAIATLVFFATNKLPADGSVDEALENAFVAGLFGISSPSSSSISSVRSSIGPCAECRDECFGAGCAPSPLQRPAALRLSLRVLSNLFLVFLTMGLMRPGRPFGNAVTS